MRTRRERGGCRASAPDPLKPYRRLCVDAAVTGYEVAVCADDGTLRRVFASGRIWGYGALVRGIGVVGREDGVFLLSDGRRIEYDPRSWLWVEKA